MKQTYYCEKCRKTMAGEEFYISNNKEKYPPDGHLHQCKKCLTMHVDNWNPDTYLWILEMIDVPYLPDIWNECLRKYGKDPERVTGKTILGRYLSQMKLKQHRDYRWADTEYLQEVERKKKEDTMRRQGFSAAEIDHAIKTGIMPIPEKPVPPPEEKEEVSPHLATGDEDYFARDDDTPDFDLSDEEKTYLKLKWGRSYKLEEQVRLEQLYNQMDQSYDIQTAGHKDTLLLVCKTSLKANQLLDIGDVDGAQKMIKMYDSLMKSGKFTAAQNKATDSEYIDSISELVAICEKDGFIPRYYTDGPQDKVDKTLLDLQNYTRSLVTEEMNLGNLIESALKQIQDDKEKEKQGASEAAEDEELLEEELFSEDALNYITDEDFQEFNESEEELAKEDAQLFD